MIPLTTSIQMRAFIKKEEGLRLTTYKDSGGICTGGWGHNLGSEYFASAISLEQATKWFDQDIESAERLVKSVIHIDLNQQQFDALVSFCFNVTQSKVSQSMVVSYINQRKFIEALSWLIRWCHDNAQNAQQGLFVRRMKESFIFLGLAPGYFLHDTL